MLLPLTALEAREYVEHRLRLCRASSERIFARRALDHLVRRSGGVPRRINALCHNALLLAYSSGVQRVTVAMAKEAVADYAGVEEVRKNAGRAGWPFARAGQLTGSLGLVLGVAVAGFVSGHMLTHHNPVHRLSSWALRTDGRADTVAMPVVDVGRNADGGMKVVLGPTPAHAAEQSPPHAELSHRGANRPTHPMTCGP